MQEDFSDSPPQEDPLDGDSDTQESPSSSNGELSVPKFSAIKEEEENGRTELLEAVKILQSLQKPKTQYELSLSRQSEQFSGPLPHPKILDAYDKILPGAAERIFSMAECQAEHRRSLELIVIKGDSVRANLGLAAAVGVALISIAAAVYLAVNGHGLVATALVGSNLVAGSTVFIYGTNSRKEERAEKRQALLGNLGKGEQERESQDTEQE